MIQSFVEYVITTEAPVAGFTTAARATASREGGAGSKQQKTDDYRKKKARLRADHFRLKSRGFPTPEMKKNASKSHRLRLKNLRTGYLRSVRTRR